MPSRRATASAVSAAVAGRHHHLQPERAKCCNRLGRRRPNRIGDRDDAGELSVEGEEHDGLAILAALGCRGRHRLERNMLVVHQPAIAEEHGAAEATLPVTPLPASASKSPAFSPARLRSRAAATIASASGCSLPASIAAA